MNDDSPSNCADLAFLSNGGFVGELIRAHAWDSSPLGPARNWPQSLRSALSICLGSSFQIALYWGEELCLLYNDAWSPILGTKHPEALGKPGREVWPEIWDTIGPMFNRVFATGEATRSKDELLAMHRHGFTEECYFDYTFSPIRDEAGKVNGIFNAVVETTFRVIGERRTRLLRDLGERLVDLLIPEAVCAAAAGVIAQYPADLPFALVYLADPDLSPDTFTLAGTAGIEKGSPGAPAILEPTGPWPVRDALEVQGSIIRVPNLSQRLGCPLSGGPWPEPCEHALIVPLTAAGASDFLGLMILGLSPRLVPDGDYQMLAERMANVLSGALSRSRMREHEQRRAEALAELDRAKTAFFSNVSHEFRTPLTLLLGPLEESLQEPSEGLKGEELRTAHRNALRLLRLVNTLLDFSRIEAGRHQARFVPTDLSTYTNELASLFRSAMERAGLTFAVDCPPQPELLYVDRDMWEKIVLNLVSNAFKYTLNGEVRVDLRSGSAAALLVVSDTGQGISPKDLPHLFDRFYRVPGAQGRTHEGSGIGLALVRELVKLHGGSIDVLSSVGEGTSFRVHIPYGVAHLPSEQIHAQVSGSTAGDARAFIEEANRWIPASEEIGDSGVFRPLETSVVLAADKPTILLADDNRDMREYVTRLLETRFHVVSAQDGQQALELIDVARPDLVLSDVMMPRLDGFGLLKALRARSLTKNVPFIFLSARAGEEARIEGFDVGADDYLVKPFSGRELITRIDTHVRLSRQRREVDQRKDVFLATLAHELRNPLAPIRNAAHMLGSPKLGAEQLEWARKVIQRQVSHMALLLDDLLDVARITQGKLELKKQAISLVSVVDAAVEAVKPLLQSKQHQLETHLPPEPILLQADPLRLTQVLSNLLTNAAKYTNSGGHIILSARLDDARVVLSVKDDGIGIPTDSLKGIFGMFSQIEGAATHSEGGLGIGLALVKGLTELHGGSVEAKSGGAGQGSEFIVFLPVSIPQDKKVTLESNPTPTSRLRVLIADDNQDSADTMGMLLEMQGHDVRIVHDGQAALSVAETFLPQAALIDIGMPLMDGYEVAKALRQTPWGKAIKLFALTGWGQESDRQRALDAGFDRHLTKPINPDALDALLSFDRESK